jgi:hypothetical protein
MLKIQGFPRDKFVKAIAVYKKQSTVLVQQPPRQFGAMDQINFD